MHRSTLQEALELSLLLADHDIDPLTSYCRACGQAMGHILAHRLQCFRAPNIVAFSHRRAAQRLEQSVEAHRNQRLVERMAAARRNLLDETPRLTQAAFDDAIMRIQQERLFYTDDDLPPIQFTDVQDHTAWLPDEPA